MVAPSPDHSTPVRVRLFAALRERAGWGERLIPLETSLTSAADLWHQLALDDGPAAGASDLPPSIRVAINQAFATPDTPLRPGDEVAFLPPITGG
ncbi:MULTISPECIES: molybdopterin converting factor subunit 1 [unclassified Cyanobium]|uniref:molybdopterin converting factor subunit 1 n=1 Tax=unclassified Cyanobium TaxID=2627006 RepID=UPI0020CCF453|nr:MULTISPECIES: molybdopterin converting factor subunit 1 [unclassified Cyanobium]